VITQRAAGFPCRRVQVDAGENVVAGDHRDLAAESL
jgi:hypothetical protein